MEIGNPVDALAFQLYRIENGQLAEHWEVADFATLVQQIQA
ncbi:ester cyclase [Mucilaginibacter sp. X4EP1]|nr:ester cyclase [Mucilaginibacter sp. X4EP1]MCS3812023.1 putative SnoaL-like aldol condensation-catalyzing enzyme [Mucilaginibacter sp. X4EP1]